MAKLIQNSPLQAGCHLIFTHGAGAPVTSPIIDALSDRLSQAGIRITRFEFDYMAARRTGGATRPPPRVAKLMEEFRAVVQEVHATNAHNRDAKVIIGGKSMGGRVASMIADELFKDKAIAGWLAVGYPFHPAKSPDRLRTEHLLSMRCPGLIVQGTRDALGNQMEVGGYGLAKPVCIRWCEDGDHDLKPRKASGLTHDDALALAADAIEGFCKSL